MRQLRKSLLIILTIIIIFVLIAPMLVVVPLAFTNARSYSFPPKSYSARWLISFWEDSRWTDSMWLSLTVALLVAVLGAIIGLITAFTLKRLKTKAAIVLGSIVILPMIVPEVVLAVGIFKLFGVLHLNGTLVGFALAHTAGVLPLVVAPLYANLAVFDSQIVFAARSLGATAVRAFLRISLVLLIPGLLAGSVFAFAHSWDEVMISLFISTPTMTTLPVRLYSAVANDIDPTLAAVSVLLFGATILVIIASVIYRWLSERRAPRA